MSYLEALSLFFYFFILLPIWFFIVVKTIAKAWHGGVIEAYAKVGKQTNQSVKGETNGKTWKK